MLFDLVARVSRAVAVSLALLAAHPIAAHNVDPLEFAPRAPAHAAPVEVLAGEVRTLTIEDRVANITIVHRSLELADGTRLKLTGPEAEHAAGDHRVQVTGRRNGSTLFVSDVRDLGRALQKPTDVAPTASVEGELRVAYADYFDAGGSRLEFEVQSGGGEITPLAFHLPPDALQRGMRIEVRGALLQDGAIDPAWIAINALPDAGVDELFAKAGLKATKTDNVLVILMRFNDSPAQPFTQAQVQAVVAGGPGSNSVAEYYREASFGQQLINATVTPWLSTGASTPPNCDWRAMGTLGRNAATAAGYTLANHHKLVYVFPRVSACGWQGLGYIGGSGAWINGANTVLVHGHELGHNFGLSHAGSLDCGTRSIGGSCSVSAYGDPFGIMGNKTTMHVNSVQKLDLGWIAASTVKTHTTGTATYTLSPLGSGAGGTYAVKVRAATNRTYWLEYRRPTGFDAGLASYPNSGIQVRVASPFETLCGGCDSTSNDTQIVDMAPATSTFTDATLVAGQSFTDTTYGITFNVLSANASAATVQVVAPGASPAPTTTVLVSSADPSVAGSTVTFTATVTGTAPTGTVAFRANGVAIAGCSALALAGSGNARTAACSTASLASGTHAIVAAYGGDAVNAVSTSAVLTQDVTAAGGASINVALASAGAAASASTTFGSGYPASSTINNERAGRQWSEGSGGWKDATAGAWPDWLQVNFNGSRTIDRVVVYSVQDNYTSPVEPTAAMTFSLYGLRDFSVQGWNGTTWVTLASVAGNTLVKRTVTFAAVTTDRIRILVASGLSNHSRITEVEAWSVPSNVALASAGAAASASTTFGSGYPASSTINNERAGRQWSEGSGGWKDATAGAWPDWLQVTFNGSRTIDRVVVYSVQDNYTSPVEPTAAMTFSLYGLRDFSVQGWNGTTWVTLATVAGNTLVKRTVTFAAVTTDRIRILVTSGLSNHSRITEVEAWGH